MKQYEMMELCFPGAEPVGSLVQVDVQAVFTCGEKAVTVKGFYDGNGIYKVRFLPDRIGTWSWKVTGLVSGEGTFECEAGEKHGMVQANGIHFYHQDGAKYLPFGTTVYALTHQPDELVEQTLETLKNAPFNKVRMCVFPKHYDLIKNEPPCHPFALVDGKPDVHKPDLACWKRFEGYLDRLEELGIQVDLILFHPYDRWGYSSMPMEDNFVYLDYVMRRLAARPNIWWSMANEFDIVASRVPEDWYAIEDYIHRNDPFHHLLSNHNCTYLYDFTRENVTHCCIQTAWVEHATQWLQEYRKPLMYDEMCYEGNLTFNWGNISGREMSHRFWMVCTAGAYGTHGETFMSDKGIIWWATGGKLVGESIPRIRFLKELLDSFPAPLSPDPKHGGMAALRNATPEQLQMAEKLYPGLMHLVEGVRNMEPGLRAAMENKDNTIRGCCGTDVFLTYYGCTCPYQAELELPDDGTYTVEVIDTWNMTRTVVKTGVHGKLAVALPSREYMAVLSTRE